MSFVRVQKTVHAVVGAFAIYLRGKASSAEKAMCSLRETVMHLTHAATLLNRQLGGFYTSYVPETFNIALFRGHETDLYLATITSSKMPCGLNIKSNPILRIMAEYSKISRMKILGIPNGKP